MRRKSCVGRITAWRYLAVCLISTVVGHAVAQEARPPQSSSEKTLTISVPEGGEHFVRVLPSSDAKGPAPLPTRFLDRTFKFPYKPEEVGQKARIAVDNPRKGISAIRPLTGPGVPDGGVLDLKAPDFDHVRELRIKVTFEGKPVAAARVTLKDRNGQSITKVIDPARQGVAVFEDVPMGRGSVTITYGEGFKQTQDVEVVGGQAPGPVEVSVPVVNRVPTVEPASPSADAGAGDTSTFRETSGATSSAPGAARSGGGGITGLLGTLIGLVVAGGVLYLLYRWSASGGLAATLKKVGVEVSGPQPEPATGTPWQPNAPPPPVVADPTLCQFCGQKKDAAGNCACSALPGDPGAVPTTPGMPVQPRLVGVAGTYSGSIFTLEGTVTIGREPTNSIPLANDNTVSRRHASIRSENGGYMISDEGSSNGTFVNGIRISGAHPLRPGDEVQIGSTRFRFEV